MRNAKDFFRPLALGAPEPVREIPVRPSRVIHFFPGANPKMVAKVPDIAPTVDITDMGGAVCYLCLDENGAACPLPN